MGTVPIRLATNGADPAAARISKNNAPVVAFFNFETNGQFLAVTRQLLSNAPFMAAIDRATEADHGAISRQPVASPARMLFFYNNGR